ncbi:hypothetical protein NitYY0918_C0183 [Nitratiruptor sp. YY09-18]|nr:hypothetical protein NitYY0918_C0183 [Nitratiruptor sp. YY09-18]
MHPKTQKEKQEKVNPYFSYNSLLHILPTSNREASNSNTSA